MAQLTPSPKFTATYIDGDGYVVPLVGGKLYAYAAGTSTPKDTYTTSTLGAANTNPVILDANGQADVWLSGGYKLILKDADDVTLWTVDNVVDVTNSTSFAAATLTGTLTVTSTAVTWSGNPTHSGNHTFANNVVFNGNVTIGDSAADTMTVTPNAVTWSNNPTHSGNHTWSGTQTTSSTVTHNGAVTSAAAHTFSTAAPTCSFGATFGNTARSGTTVLDWYDELPTFTPVFSFGGGTSGMSSTITSNCTRIGNLVFVYVKVSLTVKGASTGTAKITGMPFTCNNASAAVFNCLYDITGTPGPVSATMAIGTTEVTFVQHVTPTNLGTSLDDTYFSNGDDIRIQGFYFT